jgi:hypothetical protein
MIEHVDWNLFKTDLIPHAVLSKKPEHFEKSLNIKFFADHDGLDYFKAAMLSLQGGTVFALKQYRGHTPETTTIYLKPDMKDVDQITKIVGSIVDELALQRSDIVWQRKDDPLT